MRDLIDKMLMVIIPRHTGTDDDDDVVLKQDYLPPCHLQQQPQLQRWPLGRR